MTSSETAYEVRDVALSYGRALALDAINLTIQANETVALVGPSGAGKSSLLRLLAGTLRPTRGVVKLFGSDVAALPLRSIRPQLVGLMTQQLDLVPQLLVKHNIQAGALGRWSNLRALAALLLPVEDPRARRAAERVGIGHRFEQRTSRCSGGEQQRTALARLIIQDPRVLLVDEPVSALDPTRSQDLLELLRTLANEDGRALVASLHAPGFAVQYFDRVIGLRDGRCLFDIRSADVTDEILAEVYRMLPLPSA